MKQTSTAKKNTLRKIDVLSAGLVVFAFTAIGGFSLFTRDNSNIPNTQAAGNYTLHWSDEFSSASIDTTRWGVYHNNYGSGNNELECNTPSNAAVTGGSLLITGKKQTYSCPGAGTYQYTSAFLGSRDASTPRYYPLYGKYEMRARVPHGQGLWPAFWLRHKSGSSNAEVDILELFHNQAPGKVTSTLHFPNTLGSNVAKKTVPLETATQATGGWHTYAVEIEPAGTNAVKFTFFIDNVESFNYTNTNASSWVNGYENGAWDIAVNMAIGGNWVGHPEQQLGYLPYPNKCGLTYATPTNNDPSTCPTTGIFYSGLDQKNAEYYVDYVRVYTPAAAVTNPPTDINNDGTVNALDLSALLSKWNTTTANTDLNSDGTVNALDLSMLLSKWGTVSSTNFVLGTTKPSASNTGVPSGTTLTPLYGDQIITTPGTVIDGKDIYGFVSIRAANVTIKNSKIRGRDTAYNSASNGHLIDVSNAAATGTVIERNVIRPDYPRWWMNAIYGGNYTANRNDISGVVDGFTVRSGTTTITGNYLHDFFFSDQSADQANSNPPSWTHNDGIQFRIASGSGPHLVQGNNFYWYPDEASPDDRTAVLRTGYSSGAYAKTLVSPVSGKLLWGSGITASPDLGPITGATVTQNWFEGGTACFQMSTLSPAAGPMDFGTISNNKFGMDQYDYGNGSRYQIRYKNGGVIAGLTTNVFDPDAASVPANKKGVAFSVGFTGGIRIDP